ncbi:MAG: dihydrolipoyl dehydrogenase [DPANN group archaeon]|nr:dihydrolipoyl dehydrogenase [DPANN group archaeon]
MVVGSLQVETDVLVIGAGPGGYVAAIRAAQLGKTVTLVDREKALGGICLQKGCIPTKALVHASDYFHTLQELDAMGILVKEYHVDIGKMMAWKDGILERLDKGIHLLCEKNGIDIIVGTATFISSNEVHIGGKSDINSIIFRQAIIATGSSPVEIPNFPFSHEKILSSSEALSLAKLPETLIIIGGGYIGTEMGTVYGKLGSTVHIIEKGDRLIPSIEEELVRVVEQRLKNFNIHPHYRSTAVAFSEKEGSMTVTYEEQGVKKALTGDCVLVVVGRRPNSQGLGLDHTQVKLDNRGFIITDEQMQTSDPAIYAVGDVVGQPMLAHKASRQGKVAAEAICGLPAAFDNKVIPFVVFNDPEICSVGLTAGQAKEQGYDVLVGRFPFRALGRTMTLNKKDGFISWVAEKGSKLVLGMHAVGPSASELVGEAALAIEMGATVEDIALTIHAHPTMGESLMEAAEATMGQAIHIFQPGTKER